jgi:membrane-bound lytic murein transglycosylase D
MNRKFIYAFIIFGCLAIGFASAKLVESLKPKQVNIFERTALENKNIRFVKTPDSVNAIFPLTIEGDLFFADEPVPLNDTEVKERLDRELQVNAFWQSNTLLSMKLANRYFDEIEKILIEEGVPTDFKYLPLIESGFRDVVSPAGAAGFWQFMPPTAKRYGLEITDDIDERYNIEKATRAACAYLKEAKASLGSWTLAAASYNMGMAGISTRLQNQRTTNFYDLYLNHETSRYVFRMLAMKIIYSNPHKTGYMVKSEDLYQPYQYKKITVDTAITDLATFGEQIGVKYKYIRILNPWIRSAKLPINTGKTYELRILE